MSTIRLPTFTFPVRLAEVKVQNPDAISLQRLRAAVAGKDPDWPRAHAMARLLESDFPNKDSDFARVLANETDSPEARHLAALHLGMVATRAALDALIAHTTIRDEYVLSGVLKALGRVGDATALGPVERAKTAATGAGAAQAEFAAAFISHRLNLPGHALPVPAYPVDDGDGATSVLVRADRERLQITPATVADAELCLRSLSQRPLGVELLESPMYQMRCKRQLWMIAFNRDTGWPGPIDSLAVRKTLLAIVARRDPATARYAAAFLVFTAPDAAARGAHVLVHRVDGGLISAGHLRLDDHAGAFTLHPVRGPRPYSVSVAGRLAPERLEITAAVAGRGEKRTVSKESPTSVVRASR